MGEEVSEGAAGDLIDPRPYQPLLKNNLHIYKCDAFSPKPSFPRP